MRFFTKNELVGLGVILAVLLAVSFDNFKVSERRARDSQRKADIDSLVDALNSFQTDFGFYPPAKAGRIVACGPIKTDVDLSSRPKGAPPPEGYEKLQLFASGCEWGKDSLTDISDKAFNPYLGRLPLDPHSGQGVSYFYLSNGNIFQVFSSLESPGEPGYSQGIVNRGLECGSRVCNQGRSSADLPAELPIEELELRSQTK